MLLIGDYVAVLTYYRLQQSCPQGTVQDPSAILSLSQTLNFFFVKRLGSYIAESKPHVGTTTTRNGRGLDGKDQALSLYQ